MYSDIKKKLAYIPIGFTVIGSCKVYTYISIQVKTI